ncbi:PAP [Lepeophtheirus salmonis]|uniref:polynucleotide adenylyltransferase n=1 Tax=Lepeophtheirus salmonis TaxID=72036 RepID=A0A7R8DAM2_LEPSM|nr:PAP [Lepeophtheirus salmonis]CAF3027529.1 PAP [Lepeophtheirus salmonis]
MKKKFGWSTRPPKCRYLSLKDRFLSFSGSGTVSANDTVYETNASREKSSTLVVMRDEEGDNVAISLRSRGILNIFQSVDVPELDSMEITPPAFVAQPKNMERRHPLFGIEQPPSFGSHLSSAIKRKSLAENVTTRRGEEDPIGNWQFPACNRADPDRKKRRNQVPGFGALFVVGAPNHSILLNGGRMRTLRSSMHQGSSEAVDSAIKEGSMEDFLRQNGCFETKMGLDHRREVLHSLGLLVRQWIQSQTLEQGYHWQYANRVGGKIVTYGSYMLGISHQGADIDALFIAPTHITRENYFHSLYELFGRQREVTELRAIEEAYVPLNLPEIPHDLESFDNCMLKALDQKCVRSLNGYRSTKEILNLVPNVDIFRLALRAVKLWAKSQGIYSNIMGYLGGFSWAVLVAKTCIMHPEIQETEQMVYKFFQVFSRWNWPEPVMLRPLEDEFENPSEYSMQSWNPKKNPAERFHVMPVITPTYPHLNSTFNVTQSTLKLIQDKMHLAVRTCSQILEEKESWDTLFKTRHIFHEFEHFLFVIASAYKPLLWFGLIESKIRHFVINIERECPNLSGARIWPKPYTQVSDGKTIQLWFVGLHFQNGATLDLARPLQTVASPRQSISGIIRSRDIHEIINSSQHRNQYTPQQQQQIAVQRQQLQQLNSKPVATPAPPTLSNVREGNKESSSYAAAVSKTQHHQLRHYPQQSNRTFNTPPPINNNQSNGMMTSVPSTIRQPHVNQVMNPYINDVSPPIFERSWASNKVIPNLPSHHVVDVPSPPMTPVSTLCGSSVTLTQVPSKTFVSSSSATTTVVSVAAAVNSRQCSESETPVFLNNNNNNSGAEMSDTSYSSSIDDTESCPRGSVSLNTIPFSPGFASSPLWPISPSSSSPSNSVLNNCVSGKPIFPSTSRANGNSGTPRLSSSEIRDVASPLPVHTLQELHLELLPVLLLNKPIARKQQVQLEQTSTCLKAYISHGELLALVRFLSEKLTQLLPSSVSTTRKAATPILTL